MLCQAGRWLRAAAIERPRQEARLLLAHALHCRQEDLLRDRLAGVPPEAAERFAALLRRRLDREPVAHLLGTSGFWTLDLAVSDATLVPRPDSETLVQAALDAFPDRARVRRVLDLGTGTGCLLLALLSEFPGATGVGVDLAPAAAALARDNARRVGLGARAQFLAGDWAAAVAPDARFDLVASNPPYIESAAISGLMPEVARHEPSLALDGGADGLAAHRVLLAAIPALLANHASRAVLEIGIGQRAAVEGMVRQAGLTLISVWPDLGGIDRALVIGPSPGG
jgi:release factor glutamine methyltransferase